MRTLTPDEIGRIRISCTTQQDIIVAHLWAVEDWVPTMHLQGADTPFGFIGSAGAVRARELARGECPEKLKGKIERSRGGEIGLDARYEYFRFIPKEKPLTDLEIAARAVRLFDSA